MVASTMAAGMVPISATAAGDTALQTGNMTLALDPQTGAVTSVVLHGEERVADTLSGFRITDCATDAVYPFQAPVSGGDKLSQKGGVTEAGLTLEATYSRQGNAIRVDGEMKDTTGRERLIRLEYLLPVKYDGMYWYDDTEDRRLIERNGDYSNGLENPLQGHKMSLYPYGVISDGKHAAAVAVPMDPPQASLISYKTTDSLQNMVVRFDFALTPATKKTASKASFSFLIYAPTLPQWGFRSATQEYYDLFPEYFEVKSPGGGNWLFQHAYDQLEGIEDFSFGYNETPGSYAFDKEHGVVSFQYTAPAEQWMEWPGKPKEPEPTYDDYMGRFQELLNDTTGALDLNGFPLVTKKNVAEAMRNSATLLADGRYFTVGWYVYGETVCFITNHNPDIPGWNSYKLQISNVEKAEKAAVDEGVTLGGVYIDNLAGLGSYNYRTDHFAYADLPLLWDADKRLVLPTYSSMYSYAKAIRERCDANNQLILANMVFPERGSAQYVHMVDVPGSEMGPHWGWDPYIQRLRRTMAYRKPWMLLLGHDLDSGSTSASSCPLDIKEDIMKSAVAYGLYANVIGYRVPMTDYESSRPLFRKYTPIVNMEDALGWNPVSWASADKKLGIERFGELKSGPAIFTLYNTLEEEFTGKMTVDLKGLEVSGERMDSLMAFELVGNTPVEITVDKESGVLSYERSLKAKDVSAVIVGTKEEIWSMLFERIKATVERGDKAAEEIPELLSNFADELPSQWEALMAHMKTLSALKDKSAADALAQAKTLVHALTESVPLARAAHEEMLNFKERFEIDILNIYTDALELAAGFFGPDGEQNTGVSGDSSTGQTGGLSGSDIAIIVSALAVALAAAGTTAAVLLRKKKKN